MANFWKRIKDIFQPEDEKVEDDIDISYEKPIPLDEKFAKYFSEAGGHFLYCENQREIIDYLKKIIDAENVSRFVCFDKSLQKMLSHVGANYVDYPSATADFNFIKCESLIAYNGSIVLSADKTGGRKINELADNFIILADYDQIVSHLNDAMEILNRSRQNRILNGITSIGGVDADPMNGEVSDKNIYLLIVE